MVVSDGMPLGWKRKENVLYLKVLVLLNNNLIGRIIYLVAEGKAKRRALLVSVGYNVSALINVKFIGHC